MKNPKLLRSGQQECCRGRKLESLFNFEGPLFEAPSAEARKNDADKSKVGSKTKFCGTLRLSRNFFRRSGGERGVTGKRRECEPLKKDADKSKELERE
jgi:hypothetical protein